MNENEKLFIDLLEDAKRCCKGELELDCWDDEWYAMDYRADLEEAVQIEADVYQLPLITVEEAERKGIDVIKCCDACDVSYVA
jgi:hypothetical protein